MNMRIAIAGGGGFAYILAREIAQTSNAVLVLSTRVSLLLMSWMIDLLDHSNARVRTDRINQHHPEFQDLGVQVSIIDYADIEQLRYALRGIDLVISTVPGESQLNLINAARHSRVRTFVPSEFEGAVDHRPSSDDPLDRGSEAALRLLNERSRNERSKSSSSRHTLRYTVFSCGIFYERFQPGGLGTVLGIGAGANINNPGTYLLNVETATAEIVEHSPSGRPVVLTMTSLYDVARFVRAAVEIGPDRWPREFRMRGDQMSVMDVIGACSTAKTGKLTLDLSSQLRRDSRGMFAKSREWTDQESGLQLSSK